MCNTRVNKIQTTSKIPGTLSDRTVYKGVKNFIYIYDDNKLSNKVYTGNL